MAVPTFNENLTIIDDAEDYSTWSGWGGNTGKWDDEPDIFIEGTQSCGLQPFSTGDSGWGFAMASTFDATSNLVFIWVYLAPGFVNTSGNKGVYVRLGSDSGTWTDYVYDYLVGGSDIAWVGKGWHLIVLDANRTAGRTQPGTNPPTLSACRRVGVGFNITKTASKSSVICVDIMQYGSSFEITGVSSSDPGGNGLDFNDNGASPDTITRDDAGSFVTDGWEIGDTAIVTGTQYNDGEYGVTTVAAATLTLSSGDLAQTELNVTAAFVDAVINFQHIIDKDVADDTAFRIVDKNADGDIIINGPLTIGDVSGSLRMYFRTRNERIVKADQPASFTLITAEDTGKTVFEVGDSSGTGDDRVGFAGSIFTQYDAFCNEDWTINLNVSIDTCNIFGALFLKIEGGISFSTNTSHYVTNCSFTACGQVALGQVEARNLTFSGYDLASDAALLWNDNIDIKNSRFLANANTSSDATAIEHPTAGTYPYYGLFFSGNDFDIDFSAASGDLTINANKTSKSGCNPNSYEISGGGSTVTINNTVTLKVTCKDTDNDPIEGIRVRIEKQSDNSLISNGETNSSGEYIDSTYNYPGSDVDINYICRLKGLENFRSVGAITSDGLDVGVLMLKDEAINLP